MCSNHIESAMKYCNICKAEFSLKEEGGIEGNFGILPVSFCPYCLSSILDMSKQLLYIEDE